MATTKQKPVEMTRYQKLNHLLRLNAPIDVIVNTCRNCMIDQIDADKEDGPGNPHSADIRLALWTMATKLNAMHREIETIKRRGRRERQKAVKPQAELLKKTPETQPQPPMFSSNGS